MIATSRSPGHRLGRFRANMALDRLQLNRLKLDRLAVEAPDEAPVRRHHFLILLILLPLFGEVFHYLKLAMPLWALSKAFPLLSLPLCFVVLRRGPAPRGTRQILVMLLYLLLVPSFTAIFSFQQNFFLALTAQVKLLPILYFFSFAGLLRILKPSASEISKAFLAFSLISFMVLIALWLLVPQRFYLEHFLVGDAPLFSLDSRGDRIRMPYFFGIVGIFYCYRRFFSDKSLIWLIAAVAGYASVIGIIRTRSEVLGIALILGLGAMRFSGKTARLLLLVILPFAGAALLSIPYVASIFDTSLASGFDVRRVTLEQCLAFLGTSPVRWALGVGTISPLDPYGLIRYFNHSFFLADVTWVGTIFEYGLIGAALLLLLPLRGIYESRLVMRNRQGAFLGALQDYLLYAVAVSFGYPLTLQPGEFALILAIVVHERARLGAADPRFSHA